jgi:hypothetical protein
MTSSPWPRHCSQANGTWRRVAMGVIRSRLSEQFRRRIRFFSLTNVSFDAILIFRQTHCRIF